MIERRQATGEYKNMLWSELVIFFATSGERSLRNSADSTFPQKYVTWFEVVERSGMSTSTPETSIVDRYVILE
jgi:hypothetical protein